MVALLITLLSLMLGLFGTMMIYNPGQYMEGTGPNNDRSNVTPDISGGEIHEGAGSHNKSLPPSQAVPLVSTLVRDVRTAEMAEPPSVAENTTERLVKRSALD